MRVARPLVLVGSTLTLAAAGVGLQAISSTAAAAAPYPTTLSISAPRSVVFSHAAAIHGTLQLQGTPFGLSGEKVQLRERPSSASAWTVVAAKNTNSKGAVTFAVAPKKAEQIDLFHPADQFTTDATSATRTIKVAYDVTASLGSTSVAAAKSDTVKAAVTPSAAGAAASLQQLRSGKWVTINTRKLNGTSAVVFTFSAPKSAGKYEYRVMKAAGAGFLAGHSPLLKLTVS